MKDLDKKKTVIRKDVGDIIKVARENKHWTQEQMGDKMGITQRQYNKYEAGLFPKFKSTVAEEIDRLLGTNSKELLYEQSFPREKKDSGKSQTYKADNPDQTINDPEPNNQKLNTKNDSVPVDTSMHAILNLTESNLVLSRSHEELVMMLKKSIAGAQGEIQQSVDTMLIGLREFVYDLSIGKQYKNREEAGKAFRKKLGAVLSKKNEVDI